MKAAAVKDTAAKLLKKYPGRIPVICEPDVANSNGKASGQLSALPALDKKKFLVPGDLTVGQFIYVIRQRIKLAPEAALVVFTSMKMPATSENMSVVYDKHKAADGFLYITYTSENVFG
ncbi:symbiosis-related protein [Ramicandelaber brevisporus]|nr:symbiosis-related protein [Ramicandelaber brevisporus]